MYFNNISKNKKALSPLITTILLIVVTFALIGVVLSWGKNFTSGSLSQSTNFADFKPSDSGAFLTIDKGLNGRFLAEYNPPSTMSQDPITITYYSLLGYDPVPLEPPVTIPAHAKEALDLGIVNTKFDLVLYLDNKTQITKTGLTTVNKYPTDCPEGYIPVPGNFLYGTTYGSKMGFCVAKYEMKMDANGDSIGNLVADYPDCNTGNLSRNSWSYENCPDSNSLVSTKEGSPIAKITQLEAIAACDAIGGHLITNNEWMTIARNIEMVPNNWSSGTVGSGYIYSGHNDGNPNNILEASVDTNGYYGTGNTSGNQRRTLTLTNGETIWDLAGNVWEWTTKTILRKDMPDGFNNSGDVNNSGWNFFDYSKVFGNYLYLDSSDLGNTTLTYKDLYLLNKTYNSTNGIGGIYTYSDRADTDTTLYASSRGGHFANDYHAGILALNLTDGVSAPWSSIGLRCVK